jgi:hypothetical protein
MFNIEIIQKLENSLQLIEKYLCRYNSEHLVVHLWLVTCATIELSLAFRTNAHFVVPDTAFLATHRVTFHRFGSVIVLRSKNRTHTGWQRFCNIDPLLLLYRCDYFDNQFSDSSLLENDIFYFGYLPDFDSR